MPPIYMDRHDLPGVTAKDVAEAHQADLKIQDKYGCRALTYWFDEVRATAFCLIEAPNKDAVKQMHDHAHGLVPHHLIEVDSKLVEAFLGRIEDPLTPDIPDNADLPVFHDPAFRTIMVVNLKDAALLNVKFGGEQALRITDTYNVLIKKALKYYEGREVAHRDMELMVSFDSISQAVLCAVDIQQKFDQIKVTYLPSKLQLQIGLNAGNPVTESNELFGHTVQLAKRLCTIADNDQILVSSEVKNACTQKALNSVDNRKAIRTVNLSEENFFNNLMDITEKSWQEPEFDIHELAKQLGVSKSQLYRKIVSLTGFSPNDFIKEFRLYKALESIEKQQGNISQIAYQSGFTSPSYFSKCFHKRFGVLPSDYATTITNPASL